MKNIKNTYYFIFYKFYYIFKASANEGWEEWKSYIAVNTLGIMFIIELLNWWSIIFRTVIDVPTYWVAIPAGIIVIGNYFIFIHQNKWKKYEEKFKQYSINQSRKLSLIFLIVVIGILTSLIFSFYELGKIDWTPLRRLS